MSSLPTSEGEIAFAAPGTDKPCKTWYKLIGDLDSGRTPLIALHGGPGAGHEYMSPVADIYEKHGIPVIFYDQVGCGRSTHFREKPGDTTFWTFDLFIQELDNLIDHFQLREGGFHLLGQSWGGMLGGAYASLRPQGLKKLILCGAPASIPLMVKGTQELLAQLPEDVRSTLEECEKQEDHESPEYETAAVVFYKRHGCRLDPWPEDLEATFRNLKEDPTVYWTMQGPSEFVIKGSFKDWEGWRDAHKIEVPTLLINGRYDNAMDLCVEPWFNTIRQVKWVTLENSSHITHFEERGRFMELCGQFLVGA